jgi:hypothetical protein
MFEGPHILKFFMEWLLQAETDDLEDVTSKHEDAIVIAHNSKGYGGQFISNYLVYTACIKPKVILNGSKILSMEVCSLKLFDSYNFLPCLLVKMTAAFGLSELKKGYFPHSFQYRTEPTLHGTLPGCSSLQSRQYVDLQSQSLLHLIRATKRQDL